MSEPIYHPTTSEIATRRKELAPEIHDAFAAFSRAVFSEVWVAAEMRAGGAYAHHSTLALNALIHQPS